MQDRFELEAKLTLNRARDEAIRLNHDEVRSEHLLLSLLADRRVPELLVRMGLTKADIRSALERTVERGPRLVIDDVDCQTEEIQEVFYSTFEEVDGFGHSLARNAHLLLGLLKVPEGVACQVLEELGTSLDAARHEVLEFFVDLDEESGAA